VSRSASKRAREQDSARAKRDRDRDRDRERDRAPSPKKIKKYLHVRVPFSGSSWQDLGAISKRYSSCSLYTSEHVSVAILHTTRAQKGEGEERERRGRGEGEEREKQHAQGRRAARQRKFSIHIIIHLRGEAPEDAFP